MELLTPECKYPFIVFDDVLTQEELKSAWEEINYLDKFINLNPMESGSATNVNGSPKKKNTCLWLNDYYRNLNYSFLAKPFLKITSREVCEAVTNFDNVFLFYKQVCMEIRVSILLSKYSDGDYYDAHLDSSYYTALFWINNSEDYEGGKFKFIFGDEEIEVESKQNRLLLFPSVYQHLVEKVKYTSEKYIPRYSISTFLDRHKD